MTTVAQILDAKGHEVWSVAPDSSVYEAIERMAEKNVGALLVMQDDRVTGIVSERDYARKVILQGKSSKDTPVRDIMTSQVYYVRSQHSVEECMQLMTDHRIRHLPVMDDGRAVGMVSIGDVVRLLLQEKDAEIEHLERYITGTR